MRTRNAGTILRIPLLGVTAISTLITALKGTSFENYTFYIIIISFILTTLFIWAYDRFKVLNIQNRWDADRSDNYVGANTAINQMINARQLSILAKSINQNWDGKKTMEELDKITEETVKEFRNGLDMERFDK